MGKLTLLLVLAAALGGTFLAQSARRAAFETGARRGESQHDLLARQIAESARGIVLAAATGEEHFNATLPFAGTDQPYNGGTFRVEPSDYVVSPDGLTLTVTVTGRSGGASHTLRGEYLFDPMDFPGPLWVDAPFVTAAASGSASVSGGAQGADMFFDVQKFRDLDMAAYGLSLNPATSAVAGVATSGAGVQTPYKIQSVSKPGGGGRLVDDLGGTTTAEGLYYQVVTAKGPGDRTLPGQTLSGTTSWMGSSTITHIEGDLTISGSVTGEGALVVDGSLTVPGSLTWTGLVIVHSTADFLPVHLTGPTSITGALVVDHEAYPPGGHVDVTVMRQPDGAWGTAWGRRTAGPGALSASSWPLADPFPWLEHTHKFDVPAAPGDPATPATRTLRLVDTATEGTALDQQTAFKLRELLDRLGSTPVRLRFKNPGAHGYGQFTIETASSGGPRRGMAARGFASANFAGASASESRSFRADELQSFIFEVRSLRQLRQRWDGVGTCPGDQWPFCVGEDRSGRAGAFTIQLVRDSDDAVLYEASLYWHATVAEADHYQNVELPQWRNDILSGALPFGTDLELGASAGPPVSITYALAPLVRLADKVGWDGNQIHLRGATSRHQTAAEARAAAAP